MLRPYLLRASRHASRSLTVHSRFASSQTPVVARDAKPAEPLSPITLRDACKCSRCVDQSTMQRDFLFSDIPTNIEASTEVDEAGNWTTTWTNDLPGYEQHVSHFIKSQVQKLRSVSKKDYKPTTMLWDKATFEQENEPIKFDEYMNEEVGLAKVLSRFRRHGLVFLTGVPSEAESVARIAQRIGPLRNTFYGDTWNVRSVPQAKNVAYTSKYLGFHMDLLYMKESPGAQFLHCLENTSVGGESRFVDTFKAYSVLLSEQPDLESALRQVSVRYEYDNDGHYYTNTKPLVKVFERDDLPRHHVRGCSDSTLMSMRNLFRIYWSPPFVGSILRTSKESHEELVRKVNATKAFADMLERPELVYETKMDEGTCVIFDNLRVVHARNAFDMNSGKRWLRGCYLDSQDVTSKEFSLRKVISQLGR